MFCTVLMIAGSVTDLDILESCVEIFLSDILIAACQLSTVLCFVNANCLCSSITCPLLHACSLGFNDYFVSMSLCQKVCVSVAMCLLQCVCVSVSVLVCLCLTLIVCLC